MSSPQPQFFVATPESETIGRAYLLSILPKARKAMPLAEFRTELRTAMVNDSSLTLHQVAQALGVTRQCVSQLVGKLNRPTCAHPNRPAPKKDQARTKLVDLELRVMSGESARRAAADLGISLSMAMHLGFRSRAVRPPHGAQARRHAGCNCWRCRRAAGIALPRGRKASARQRAQVDDWLAWREPFTGERLTQVQIGKLAGVSQGAVSRISRAQEAPDEN